MIHNIYQIFDSKAEAFLPPFFMHKEGMALRIFADCCNDPNHAYGKHPEDYTLFDAGTFNDDTGTITQDKITSIANGITLVKEENNEID